MFIIGGMTKVLYNPFNAVRYGDCNGSAVAFVKLF